MPKPRRKPPRLLRKRLPRSVDLPSVPERNPTPSVDAKPDDEHPDFDEIRRMIEAAYT
jgi:hypothetical protein